jgi:hypothetical protein
MKIRTLLFGVTLMLLAAGAAWWWHLGRAGRALDAASAMVMIWDHDCEVSKRQETRGPRMPCSDVSQYLHGALNIHSGANIGIADLGNVTPTTIDGVVTDLKHSGYQVAGVIRVGFITEPPRR